MIHPSYHAETGFPNSWISVSVGRYPSSGLGSVIVNVVLADVAEQLDAGWSTGDLIFTRLIPEVGPTLGYMTAWILDDDEPVFPSERSGDGTCLPPEFTPLTYFCGPELDEQLRVRLGDLPVPVSRPFGDGWLVQAVERPHDAPPVQFLNELASLGVAYRRPRTGER